MSGKLIVIEGLDGSGKATQAQLLAKVLAERGENVREVSFPNYQSDSSALIRMYLAGQFGTDPNDVNAYAASAFYAVDRFAGFKQDWGSFYMNGGTVIADRYTTSNAIHQCAKLPRGEWDAYLQWLFRFEYELIGIPAPQAVFYLRVEPQISQRLMTGRYHGDESKKDIHESNPDYLSHAREAAEYCAGHLGWITVSCTREGTMRTVEDIHREILEKL